MPLTLYPAMERGHTDYGWLKSNYSFSFANWYHPAKIHFGTLRVLNDDTIAPHSGFEKHPHENMEIITIMLNGTLTHQDSMGNKEDLRANEVQVMSAGTGIFHSEKNETNNELSLFQIWIFPDKKNHTPRYEQKTFSPNDQLNKWQLLVSPNSINNSLWINQNAYISRGTFKNTTEYQLYDKTNGVYIMNISGEFVIEANQLASRDAVGISLAEKISINCQTLSDILIIEIPMR